MLMKFLLHLSRFIGIFLTRCSKNLDKPNELMKKKEKTNKKREREQDKTNNAQDIFQFPWMKEIRKSYSFFPDICDAVYISAQYFIK